LSACFKNTCEFYIDFFTGHPINTQYDNLLSPRCIIGVRLFHYALVDNVSFNEFLTENAKHIKTGLFDIEHVLREISTVYRSLLAIDNEDPLPIVVILDELQCTFEDCEQLAQDSQWKKISKSLADYMSNSTRENAILKRDKLLLLTTIAGILTYDDASFELFGYTPMFFPLPSFPLPTARKLATEAKIPQQYLDNNNSEFNRFWYLMGLVPRCLEFSCKYILDEKRNDLTAQQLFNLVQRKLDGIYRLGQDYTNGQDKKLLQYAMTGVNVQSEQWIQDLQRVGKVFLHGTKLYLPHPVFFDLAISNTSILPTELIKVSKEMLNWNAFKKLDMHILAQRREFAQTIRELFPGAHGDESIKNLQICKCERPEFQVETSYYVAATTTAPIVSSANKFIEINRGTIKESKESFVFQSKAKQVLIDGRLFINGQNNEKIVCLLQYKYSAQPKLDKEEQVKVSPQAWYNAIAPAIKEQYKDYLVVFVYITNTRIPTKARKAIDGCPNLLVVEQSCANEYFAPNILPFYLTATGQNSSKQ